jgi:hypothetical protein
LLTPNLNFFFTGAVIADYQSSLAPLGEIKSIVPMAEDGTIAAALAQKVAVSICRRT